MCCALHMHSRWHMAPEMIERRDGYVVACVCFVLQCPVSCVL
jgi:hypothetical protein